MFAKRCTRSTNRVRPHAPRLLPTRRAQHQLFRANQPRAPAHAFPAPLPRQLPTGFRAARAPPARPRPRAQWVASARDPLHAQQPKAPRLPLPLPQEHPSHVRARRVRLLAIRIAFLFSRSPDVCLPPLTEASEHQRQATASAGQARLQPDISAPAPEATTTMAASMVDASSLPSGLRCAPVRSPRARG